MIPTLPERVADAVAQAEKTYKVVKIAELCGVTKQTVYDWRKQKTFNLKGETLVEIAEVSGLNARWLINGKGPRERSLSLSSDEVTIVEAYRLFGDELREQWLKSAKDRVEKELTKKAADDNQSKAA